MALYVYGIIRSADAPKAVSAARAAGGIEAEAIQHGPVSALVRPAPDGQRRIGRESILGHAEVLRATFEHGPVLPVRLGTAMADADAVLHDLLAPSAEALALRLDELASKAEMQVKATYAEAPLLRSVLAADPALKRAVERSRQLPAAATHFDQIRIGEAIANAVQARRVADTDVLLSALSPFALAASVSAPSHERAALNAAFLVDSEALDRFDAAVEQLTKEHGPEMEFKLIGPLPPYSFADGEWQALRLERSSA